MEKVIPENGKATEQQIEAWKKLYPDVYEIQVDGHYCYVRGFDRTTMSFALSQLDIKMSVDQQNPGNNQFSISAEKMLKIGEIGLENCWIAGSEEIKNNDRLYVGAALQVGELFDIAESSLKKL